MEPVLALPVMLLAACGLGLLGLGGIAGFVILLLKLGVIGQHALKQEPEEVDAEYTLDQSREAHYEGEPRAK
jgi:hypothetical protein